ncbi:MAG: S41 family peptidase [Chloroflexota bacterium]|nr:S41 family peptidase [Chloroflexota bacterium]
MDVRENGGGWTGSYESIRPLLYTGPIQVYGMEAWASENNIAFFRGWLEDEHLSDEMKAQVRAALPKMETKPNRFVVLTPDTLIRLATVHPMPRKVAVLMGSGCFSSCEDFILEARQSSKVTLLGSEATLGGLAYGNVRLVWLPGWRRLLLPTSRWREIDATSREEVGLSPQVWIPEGEADAVDFARRHLRR